MSSLRARLVGAALAATVTAGLIAIPATAATPAAATKTAKVTVFHGVPGVVVNVYVNYLRTKIDRPGLVPLIHTVRGVGFALHAPAP